MGYKHQGKCYRNISGKKYTNFSDLCWSDEENAEVVAQAKSEYKSVRVITQFGGLKAVFVSNE